MVGKNVNLGFKEEKRQTYLTFNIFFETLNIFCNTIEAI